MIYLLMQLLDLSVESILRVRNIWYNNIFFLNIILNGRQRVGTQKHVFIFWIVSLFKHYLTLFCCNIIKNRLYFTDVAVAWIWISISFFNYLVYRIIIFQKVFTVFNITFYQYFCKYWTSLLFYFTVIWSLWILWVR